MTADDLAALERCEAILRESRAYNTERDILPSENVVIGRLLEHADSMKSVYSEISRTLNYQQVALFLDIVLACAAFWNPEKAAEYRQGRQALIVTNKQIFEQANILADLIERREQLINESGFSSDTHYSIVDVLHNAGEDHGLYRSYVKSPLKEIRSQFDLKYWPSLQDVVREIASDAGRAQVNASDELTAAATDSTRTSKVDFLRAFFAAMNENRCRAIRGLPTSFELTDKSVADIMNSALDLPAEQQVDSTYVKRARQRFRDKQVVQT